LSIRALLSLRPPAAIASVGVAVWLAGCTGNAQLAATPDGQLFARGLDELADVYIEPVSSHRLAVAGAARLTSLDGRLAISDGFGALGGGALSLSYDGRDVAMFAMPGETDARAWGHLVGNVVDTAKRVSPRLAGLPRETIDKAVFDGMTASLDRFSRYLVPDVARDQRAARDGFGGIGVTFDNTHEMARVTAVAPHSPAERAGIRVDDRIRSLDGIATAGRAHEEIVHQLRGPVGSTLVVSLVPAGKPQPRELRLRRELVTIPTVTASRDGGILILRVTSFNHSTTQRIAEAITQAERDAAGHLAGVVLDLRGNPGGLLDQAVALANLFIRDGPIIAAIGRHPASRQYFAASGDGIALHIPVAVLINGGSASAAEIVAAALQDSGRGVVIGSSSYGKGTVQTVLHLPNGGDLIVTWARLVAPSGYLLQRNGVVPTVCTVDLGDDAGAIEAAALRLAAADSAAVLPAAMRAGLDERSWSVLRGACPPRPDRPTADLKLAERILADPRLYAQALHAVPAARQIAQRASSGAGTEAALTGTGRALSSPSR
jgi:carboxyl-terminal processing protease